MDGSAKVYLASRGRIELVILNGEECETARVVLSAPAAARLRRELISALGQLAAEFAPRQDALPLDQLAADVAAIIERGPA